MQNRPVRFIHISDTHIGPTSDFEVFGKNPYEACERVIEAIRQTDLTPDFFIHTGDITASIDEESYRLARMLFSRLPAPMYYVAGNHDSVSFIKKHLECGPLVDTFSDHDLLSYVFDLHDHRFVVLDAHLPNPDENRGTMAKPQLDYLRKQFVDTKLPVTLFVHFPPHPLDSRWIDNQMLMTNGMALHELLKEFAPRVRGVFHGHVHRGIHTSVDGLLYSSVPSVVCQFTALPEEEEPTADAHHPPSFNLVTIDGTRTVIKSHPVGID
jgi:Icc protein